MALDFGLSAKAWQTKSCGSPKMEASPWQLRWGSAVSTSGVGECGGYKQTTLWLWGSESRNAQMVNW
jgi:hypothetical protein